MTASAQGIDVSSYQPDQTASGLGKYSFAFCKVSEGLTGVDPHLPANWAAIKAAGIHRGGYHEFHPSGDPAAQARHFVAAAKAQGLVPGDMLAVVASDYAGVTSAMIRTCCDEVAALAGPHCPVLVYSDLSVARGLTTCTKYPLWIANPASSAPQDVSPWPRWLFWQWSWNPEDQDAFNGTAAELNGWIAGYTGGNTPAAPASTVAGWLAQGQKSLADLCSGSLHNGVSTVLRLTAEHSPGAVYTPAMATYLNEVFAADKAVIPAGVILFYPKGSGDEAFTSRGDQTLQGLANTWHCECSAIVRLTAEKSPGSVFSGAMATYLDGVFQRAASGPKVPAGVHLYYET